MNTLYINFINSNNIGINTLVYKRKGKNIFIPIFISKILFMYLYILLDISRILTSVLNEAMIEDLMSYICV